MCVRVCLPPLTAPWLGLVPAPACVCICLCECVRLCVYGVMYVCEGVCVCVCMWEQIKIAVGPAARPGGPGESCVKCGGKPSTLEAHAPTRGASPRNSGTPLNEKK